MTTKAKTTTKYSQLTDTQAASTQTLIYADLAALVTTLSTPPQQGIYQHAIATLGNPDNWMPKPPDDPIDDLDTLFNEALEDEPATEPTPAPPLPEVDTPPSLEAVILADDPYTPEIEALKDRIAELRNYPNDRAAKTETQALRRKLNVLYTRRNRALAKVTDQLTAPEMPSVIAKEAALILAKRDKLQAQMDRSLAATKRRESIYQEAKETLTRLKANQVIENRSATVYEMEAADKAHTTLRRLLTEIHERVELKKQILEHTRALASIKATYKLTSIQMVRFTPEQRAAQRAHMTALKTSEDAYNYAAQKAEKSKNRTPTFRRHVILALTIVHRVNGKRLRPGAAEYVEILDEANHLTTRYRLSAPARKKAKTQATAAERTKKQNWLELTNTPEAVNLAKRACRARERNTLNWHKYLKVNE